MEKNKYKGWKCIVCTFVAVGPLFFGYIFCPHCGSRLEECWVDAEENPDTISYGYPSELKGVYYVSGIESTTMLTPEIEARKFY